MRVLLIAALVFFTPVTGEIQPTKTMNSAEIQLALKKMQILGSVLYVAAHPDDENTALLAYFSNERLLRTAYLAITRGSGGQNLIGTEKGEQLGILRTQELLAARSIDGAEQFFTRAIDFGYSKNPEETLKIWDKQKVLSDVVWVIRKFRPDVIVTRFTPEIGGHGHHRSSAILAEEAFRAAADPTQFPEQLEFIETWQVKRLVWNAWSRYFSENNVNTSELASVDLGKYNTLLGKAYMEIAAKSRTMHKSQGFGMRGYRGELPNYFIHTAGDSAKTDLLEDVDLTWNRVEGGQSVSGILEEAYQRFNPEAPAESIPLLVSAYKQLNMMPPGYWVDVKKQDLKRTIQACAGIWMEAISDDYSATPGEKINLTMMVVNRSNFDFTLSKITKPLGEQDTVCNCQLENNQPIEWNTSLVLPEDMDYSQPYWLRENPQKGMYIINNQQMVEKPESEPVLKATFELSANDLTLQFETPVLFTWTDRVKGELYRSLEIVPKVSVDLQDQLYVFPNDEPKKVRVKVTSGAENISGNVKLLFDDGWKADPISHSFSLSEKLAETFLTFTVFPPTLQTENQLLVQAEINGQEFSKSSIHIDYDHIPIQTFQQEAGAKLIRLNLKRHDEKIGYVMGSGDDIPQSLDQLGYQVALLSDDDLENENLNQYDVIITGIRAYNTRDKLEALKQRLMKFVADGGTLIDQYNTTWGLKIDHLGPYPFKLSHDRVSVEEAPVEILDNTHSLLNYPNKITEADFEGWIQERGLYFAEEWDSKYQTVLSSHDPGETAKVGGLLYTTYGKGHYIYTGYSWFRELPAGVSGAFRIFVNMISAGSHNES